MIHTEIPEIGLILTQKRIGWQILKSWNVVAIPNNRLSWLATVEVHYELKALEDFVNLCSHQGPVVTYSTVLYWLGS